MSVEYSADNKNGYCDIDFNNSGATFDSNLQPSTLTIPENLIYVAVAAPLIPLLVMWLRKKKLAFLENSRERGIEGKI